MRTRTQRSDIQAVRSARRGNLLSKIAALAIICPLKTSVAALAIAGAGIASAAPNSLAGHWPGRLQCDSAVMMRKAKTPEHRKLLKYTMGRLRQAAVSIDLNRDRSFQYSFDDGYAADHDVEKGRWAESKSSVILIFDATHRKRTLEKIGPHKLLLRFDDIPGLSATFQR